MAEPSRPSNGALTSWKEIANFFSREVRTVQLWEKEEGLPVHRHLHRRQASVYAYPEELDRWWKERGSEPLRQATDGEDLRQPDETGAAAPGEIPLQTAPASIIHTPPADGRKSWRAYAALVGIAILAAWGLWTKGAKPPAAVVAPSSGMRLVADPAIMRGFASAMEVDDINGDGHDDFVFSAEPNHTELRIKFGHANAIDATKVTESDFLIRGTGRGGLSVATSDVNGDGIRDLIVAEVFYEPYLFNGTGDTFLFWGRREWPKSLQLADADVTLKINASNDARLGVCPAWKGSMDLNGDGAEDLLLSAHEYTEDGRRSAGGVFVFWGRKAWPKQLEVIADSDVRIVGARTGEGLAGPCNTGDFNGDGRADLAVYASNQTLWAMRGSRGRAHLFLGKAKWPKRLDAATDYDLRIDADHEVIGNSFLLADINGDGQDDAVLFHSKNKAKTQVGEVMAWFGGSSRRGAVQESDADLRIETEWPKLDWGSSLHSADVDGDGIQDILLATPQTGAIAMLYGRREWQPRGPMAQYSPVTLFQGRPGIAQYRLWIRDVDEDLLPELVLWSAVNSPASQEAAGWIVNMHQELALDVRPTSKPNILHLPDGLLVAAVKGQTRAAAEIIDVTSVRLAGAPPTEHVEKDYDGDGVKDLQFYFETATLRVTPETKRVVLTARTREGLPAGATDSVQVVMKSAAQSGAATSPD